MKNKWMKPVGVLCCLLFPLLCASAVQAKVIELEQGSVKLRVRPNREDFELSHRDLTCIDFEGIADPGQALPLHTPQGLTRNGVTFTGRPATGEGYHMFVASRSHGAPARDWGTGDTLVGDRFGYFGDVKGFLRATLPANTTVVGTDFMTALSDGNKRASKCVFRVYAGGQKFEVNSFSAGDAAAFIGFESTAPIDAIEFTTVGTGLDSPYGALDNFCFKADTPTTQHTIPAPPSPTTTQVQSPPSSQPQPQAQAEEKKEPTLEETLKWIKSKVEGTREARGNDSYSTTYIRKITYKFDVVGQYTVVYSEKDIKEVYEKNGKFSYRNTLFSTWTLPLGKMAEAVTLSENMDTIYLRSSQKVMRWDHTYHQYAVHDFKEDSTYSEEKHELLDFLGMRLLLDMEMNERIAKALSHAIKLSQGKEDKKETGEIF